MKNKTCKRFNRIHKIEEHKIYYLKQFTNNILLPQQNHLLHNCLERIK